MLVLLQTPALGLLMRTGPLGANGSGPQVNEIVAAAARGTHESVMTIATMNPNAMRFTRPPRSARKSARWRPGSEREYPRKLAQNTRLQSCPPQKSADTVTSIACGLLFLQCAA